MIIKKTIFVMFCLIIVSLVSSMASAIVCTDSDGGKDYYKKGIITAGVLSSEDYCHDANLLVDYECREWNGINYDTGYSTTDYKVPVKEYGQTVNIISIGEDEATFQINKQTKRLNAEESSLFDGSGMIIRLDNVILPSSIVYSIANRYYGRENYVCPNGCKEGACVAKGAGCNNILINEDFSNDLSNWQIFGLPRPYIDPIEKSLNNNGDSSWESGILSKTTVDFSAGAEITFDAKDTYHCTPPCWEGVVVGLTTQSSLGNNAGTKPIVGMALAGEGTYIGFIMYDVWEATIPLTDIKYHSLKIVIRQDLFVDFYVDGNLEYTSKTPLSLNDNNAYIVAYGRSSHGGSRIDNIKVSVCNEGNSCTLTDKDCPMICADCATGYTGGGCNGGIDYETCTCKKPAPCVQQNETVKETVTCVFEDGEGEQECYSEKGSCKAYLGTKCKDGEKCQLIPQMWPEPPVCKVEVSGKKGEEITWKSSCGGYAYTVIDGEDEYAKFDCKATPQPTLVISRVYANGFCPDGCVLNLTITSDGLVTYYGENVRKEGKIDSEQLVLLIKLFEKNFFGLDDRYDCKDEPMQITDAGGVTFYFKDKSREKSVWAYNGCELPYELKQINEELDKIKDSLVSPTVCTMEYDPVCGSDDQTYPNSCFAEVAGVKWKKGECSEKKKCDAGCEFEGTCVPYGFRTVKNVEPQLYTYCNINSQFNHQKHENAECQNSYECLSNQCSNGRCIDLEKQLKETQSTLNKIMDWLRRLFS